MSYRDSAKSIIERSNPRRPWSGRKIPRNDAQSSKLVDTTRFGGDNIEVRGCNIEFGKRVSMSDEQITDLVNGNVDFDEWWNLVIEDSFGRERLGCYRFVALVVVVVKCSIAWERTVGLSLLFSTAVCTSTEWKESFRWHWFRYHCCAQWKIGSETIKEPTLSHELLGLKSFLNNQNLIWFFEFLF